METKTKFLPPLILKPPSQAAAPIKERETAALTKIYKDTFGNFTVKYPPGWIVKSKTTKNNGELYGKETTLTSPKGTVLHLDSDLGGRGGGCTPAPTDKPFKKGNVCSTYEYLSSELLPIKNVYYPKEVLEADKDSVHYAYEPTDIMLVTSHIGYSDGTSTYVIGLEDSPPDNRIKVNDPYMSLVIGYTSVTVYNSKGKDHPYIYAYSKSSSASFLKGNEAEIIKDILSSLRLDI